MTSFSFTITDTIAGARLGSLRTAHGTVSTPAVAPVADQGTVKSLAPEELQGVGVVALAANSYHLLIQPGVDRIHRFGGLHNFMSYPGPLLSTSGATDIYALPRPPGNGLAVAPTLAPPVPPVDTRRRPRGQGGRLVHVDETGITFTSFIDGATLRLTPEDAIAAQSAFGSDIAVALHPPHPGHPAARRAAPDRALRWASRALEAPNRGAQALFTVLPNNTDQARPIAALPFDGFVVQALHSTTQGNPRPVWDEAPVEAVRLVDAESGFRIQDLIEAIAQGADVITFREPVQLARLGIVYTKQGLLDLGQAVEAGNFAPIDESCRCPTCSEFTRAYVHHLFAARELLAYRLATLHNWCVVAQLLERIRVALRDHAFDELRRGFAATWRSDFTQGA